MTDDIRDQLAEALPEHWGASDRAELVDTLLPVVESIAVERAAAELEAVGGTALSAQQGMGPVRVHVRHLFNRAAALRRIVR